MSGEDQEVPTGLQSLSTGLKIARTSDGIQTVLTFTFVYEM